MFVYLCMHDLTFTRFMYMTMQVDYEVVGDHVTSVDTCAPMKSRQLHQNEVIVLNVDLYYKKMYMFMIMLYISYSHLDCLLTVHFSLLVHLTTYHKVYTSP